MLELLNLNGYKHGAPAAADRMEVSTFLFDARDRSDRVPSRQLDSAILLFERLLTTEIDMGWVKCRPGDAGHSSC